MNANRMKDAAASTAKSAVMGSAAAGSGQWALMRRLQEVGLALADLTEYLDTHPYDSFAIERYHIAAADYQQLLESYEQTYGPLVLGSMDDRANWQWALQDFPWDYEV